MPEYLASDQLANVSPSKRAICVAPMMDWTDRHCRFFLRLLNPAVGLYSEMVTTGAILHGDTKRFLAIDPSEHPVALQLGGSDPSELAEAARLGWAAGFDEINLNVGCPSDRVQSGRFGACLMTEPELVSSAVSAMRDEVGVPVTVKNRLGIDGHEDYSFVRDFVSQVAEAGCDTFIVHARIAVLQGLSPKQNREIPPLRYADVYRLKDEFPDLRILVNGGIRDTESAAQHLEHADGIMIGRQAYNDPWFLTQVAFLCGPGTQVPQSRAEVVRAMVPYADAMCARGVRLWHIVRHMLGLYNGQSGARQWRRFLSEACRDPTADPRVLERSLSLVPGDA